MIAFYPTIDNEQGNEFYYSDMVSNKFKTNHHVYNITQDELFKSLDDVIRAMPEPMFSQDSAAFYLLAKEVSNSFLGVPINDLSLYFIFKLTPITLQTNLAY